MKKTISITLSVLLLTSLLVGLISAETPTRTESCYTYPNQWKVCTEKQTIDNDFIKNDQLHVNSKTLTKLSLYNAEGELIDKVVYKTQNNALGTDPCEGFPAWDIHTRMYKGVSVKVTVDGFIITITTEKTKDGELQFSNVEIK